MTDYMKFVIEKIQFLRNQLGISARKMSLDLGQNPSFIAHLEKGNRMKPTLSTVFKICDYFGITPQEFFSENLKNKKQVVTKKIEKEIDEIKKDNAKYVIQILQGVKNFDEKQLKLLIKTINHMQ